MPKYRITCASTGKALSDWTTDTTKVANLAQTIFAGRDVSLDIHRSNRRLIG